LPAPKLPPNHSLTGRELPINSQTKDIQTAFEILTLLSESSCQRYRITKPVQIAAINGFIYLLLVSLDSLAGLAVLARLQSVTHRAGGKR
jgi:hypothetical protein